MLNLLIFKMRAHTHGSCRLPCVRAWSGHSGEWEG